MKHIILLLLPFLILSCADYKSGVKKLSGQLPQVNRKNYADFETSVVLGISDYKDSTNIDEESRMLARAIGHITDNEYPKAVPLLWQIQENMPVDSPNEVKWYAYSALYSYYRTMGRVDSINILKKRCVKEPPEYCDFLIRTYDSLINNNPRSVCYPDHPDTLKIIEDDTGWPIVEAKINGKPCRLVFDTGAMVTIIERNLARDAGIRSIPNTLQTMGSSNEKDTQADEGFISQFTFGETTVNNQYTMISVDDEMKQTFLWFFTVFDVDGMIGWDVIKDLDITYNLKDGYIIIRKPGKREVRHKNLYTLYHPVAKCTTATGFELNAHIDTGANCASVHEIILNFLDDKETDWEFSFRSGIAGSVWGTADFLQRLKIFLGDTEIDYEELVLKENTDQTLKFDMILGIDIARDGWLRIDNYNSIIELIPFTQ